MTLTLTDKEMDKIAIIKSLTEGYIDIQIAKEKLGVSERTIYRYKSRYKKEGRKGLTHKLKGRPSNHRGRKMEKIKKYVIQKKYRDFGPTLLAEELTEYLGYEINRESLRLAMIRRGLWIPKKRKVKRQLRVRRKKEGIMIQFDGSYHDRLEDGIERCVLLAIDDATGKIKKMKITKSESFEEIEKFWKEYLYKEGKPESIYLDKHSTYKVNHGKDLFTEEMLTRFARGMRKLGIQVIYANSPEGKGRVERAFRTLQDRLIKKMRLRGIKNEKEATKYFKEYIKEHNKKYSIKAVLEGDSHKPLSKEEKKNFKRFFSKRSERILKRNGAIQYNKKIYQVKRGETLRNGNRIEVLEASDGEIKLYSGNYELCIEKVYQKI